MRKNQKYQVVRDDVIRISVRQMQGGNQEIVLSAALKKSQRQEPGVKDMKNLGP